MTPLNKYKIDWVTDDSSFITSEKPSFWKDVWDRGRNMTIFAEADDAFDLFESVDARNDFIDQEDWNASNFFYRPGVEWFNGMTRSDARLLADTFDEDLEWQQTNSQLSSGAATSRDLLSMGVGMIFDETNLIPLGIGFQGVKALSKVPALYKSILGGAATTAAFTTAEQFLIYPQAEWNRRQREVKLPEQLTNIALGTVIGGGIAGGGHFLGNLVSIYRQKRSHSQDLENKNIADTVKALDKKLNDATEEINTLNEQLEFDFIDRNDTDLDRIDLSSDGVRVRGSKEYDEHGAEVDTNITGDTADALSINSAEDWYNAKFPQKTIVVDGRETTTKSWQQLTQGEKSKFTKAWNKSQQNTDLKTPVFEAAKYYKDGKATGFDQTNNEFKITKLKGLKQIDEARGMNQREASFIKENSMVNIREGMDGIVEINIRRKNKAQQVLEMLKNNMTDKQYRIVFDSFNKGKRQEFLISSEDVQTNLRKVLKKMNVQYLRRRSYKAPKVRLFRSEDGKVELLVYENRKTGDIQIVLKPEGAAQGNFKGGTVLGIDESKMLLKHIEDKDFASVKRFLNARNTILKENADANAIDVGTEKVEDFELAEQVVKQTQTNDKQKLDKIETIEDLDNLPNASGVKNADMDAINKGETTRPPTTDEKRANADSLDTDLTLLKTVNDEMKEPVEYLKGVKGNMSKYVMCKIKNIAKWIK